MTDRTLTAALLHLERKGEIYRRTDSAGVVRWVHMDYLPRAVIQRQHAQGADVQTIASRLGLGVPLVQQVLDKLRHGRAAP